jgi:hypothetical protein
MFRMSKNGEEAVADVASYWQFVPTIREAGPGPTTARCVRPPPSAGVLSHAGTNPSLGTSVSDSMVNSALRLAA